MEDRNGLTAGNGGGIEDPYALFAAWMEEAVRSEMNDPEAMQVATVDETGLPDVRTVLLKGVDPRGFVFYTNSQSAKGREIAANPKAAAVFHWKSLRRQVRVRGPVERVTDGEADAYFASRARMSQIGAWASEQSRELESREVFEAAVRDAEALFEGREVERPAHWTGFRILPVAIEFWQDRPFRLHDRIVYEPSDTGWRIHRLYP